MRFLFTSLLTLGLVGSSFAVSLPFLDGFIGELLFESSEISLKKVIERQTYIVKYHHSSSYLVPRVQSGSFPLLFITFRFFFAGHSSLSPGDLSTTCATTDNRASEGKPGGPNI